MLSVPQGLLKTRRIKCSVLVADRTLGDGASSPLHSFPTPGTTATPASGSPRSPAQPTPAFVPAYLCLDPPLTPFSLPSSPSLRPPTPVSFSFFIFLPFLSPGGAHIPSKYGHDIFLEINKATRLPFSLSPKPRTSLGSTPSRR